LNNKLLSISAVLLVAIGFLAIVNPPSGVTSKPAPVTPCQAPLTYRFGNIDPRFNTSKKELKNVMNKVEKLWDTAMDRDLVNYNPNGEVVINLVYSEDQKRTEAEKKLSNRILVVNKQIDTAKEEYEKLMKAYQSQKKDLQNTIAQYQEMVHELNADLARWKAAGSVPKSKKSEIEKRQEQISFLESQIKRKQKETESKRKQVNTISKHLNSILSVQNRLIKKYNDNFTTPRKFDQGRYTKNGDQQKIDIYQFANRAELTTVLAHEIGHAMGLGHVDNPTSIMNAMMEKQDIFHLSLTKADKQAIKDRCQ